MNSRPHRNNGRRAGLGLALSDLHLLRHPNTSTISLDQLPEMTTQYQLVIFNGDMFDFEWTSFKTEPDAIRFALRWVKDLAQSQPDCKFVFLAGNHDHDPLYSEGIERLAAENPNVHWKFEYLRVGDKVFLHGDATHIGARLESLPALRRRWSATRRKLSSLRRFYHFFNSPAKIAKITSVLPKKYWARRISAYLQAAMKEEFEEIKDVYFGHTHVAFRDYVFENHVYHNSGSSIKGVKMLPLEFRFEHEDLDLIESTNRTHKAEKETLL